MVPLKEAQECPPEEGGSQKASRENTSPQKLPLAHSSALGFPKAMVPRKEALPKKHLPGGRKGIIMTKIVVVGQDDSGLTRY